MKQRFIQQVAQCRESVPSIGRKALVILLVLSLVSVPVAGQLVGETIDYDSIPAGWTGPGDEASHSVEPQSDTSNYRLEYEANYNGNAGSIAGDWVKFIQAGNYTGSGTVASPRVEVELRDATSGASFGREDDIYVAVYGPEGSTTASDANLGTTFWENVNDFTVVMEYRPDSGEWYIRLEDQNGNLISSGSEFTLNDQGTTPADIDGIGYGRDSTSDDYANISIDTANSIATIPALDHSLDIDSVTAIEDYQATPTPTPTATPTPYPDEKRLEFDVRNFMQPGDVADFSVYYYPDAGTERGNGYEVTLNSTTYDIENVTVNGTQALRIDSTGYRFAAVNNSSAAVQVNVTATHDAGTETLNQTKRITIAQPSVENLEIIPGALNRIWALFDDPTIFALLIAGFLSVPAARFTNAFGGLATAQMVVTIGWLAGYIGTGIAMLSVFVALFIGLNLAENVQFNSGNFGGGFR